MRIQKSNVILDDDYKNILVEDFVQNYKGVKSLALPESIVKVMNDVFQIEDQAEEYLYLIAMTVKCKPISFFEVSHGTSNASLLGIREVYIRALLCGASSIVLVHNHPSGDPTPSRQDIAVTERMKEASQLLGLEFCDHIIIGREGFYSFKEKNNVFQI